MNIKVRFTAPEDLDLIALVHSGVRMGLVIRDVLRAYVRQEIFYVPMPNTIKCINTENTSVNFILNSEKDGDVIAFLRSIRNGYKTVVIKNILRSYFTAPIMEPLKYDAFPIRVNLCWPDDLDLIILAQTQDMQELTLKALSAYVHKAKFSIDTPAIAASINADTMSFTLDLAQETDATISSFLFSIHPSARDNAIKNILRFYFQKPYIAPYLAQYTYNVQPSEHKERNITVAEKYFRPDALSNASAAAQVRPVRQTSAPKKTLNFSSESKSATTPTPVPPKPEPVVATAIFSAPDEKAGPENIPALSKETTINPLNSSSQATSETPSGSSSEDDSDGFDIFGAISGLIV